MKFVRNAKIIGIRMEPLMGAYNLWRQCANRTSKWMRTNLKNENIAEIKKYRQGYLFELKIDRKYWSKNRNHEQVTAEQCTSAELVKYLRSETDVFKGIDGKVASQCRDVINYVAERYNGYGARNKKKKVPNVHIKENKSWYFKEQFVSVDSKTKTITINTLLGKIETTYTKGLKDNKIKGSKGGNISIRRKEFVCAVECEKDTQYEPEDVLAYDMNMQENYWLTFSDGTITSIPEELKNACDYVHNTQELIREKEKPVNERSMRSKERTKLRRQWQEQHKVVNKLCKIQADIILTKVIDNSMLLAIDGVGTGQSHGTWGQDHMTKYLITRCENEGIPFYVVNPAYTSRTCSMCGHEEKSNRKQTDVFSCQSCGHSQVSHKNAAINIKNKAKSYIDMEFPYGDYSSFAKENKIKKKMLAVASTDNNQS